MKVTFTIDGPGAETLIDELAIFLDANEAYYDEEDDDRLDDWDTTRHDAARTVCDVVAHYLDDDSKIALRKRVNIMRGERST